MKPQPRRASNRNHFESACQQSGFLRSVWNTPVAFSPFVSSFRRGNILALHHSPYAETIYLDGDAARVLSPILSETMTVGSFAQQAFVPQDFTRRTVRLLALLLRQGFLAPAAWDQAQILHGLAAAAKRNRAFANLTVYMTPACNLKCRYCQDIDVIPGRRQTMALDTLDKALDVLRHTPRGIPPPKRSVQFFGGEPLVAPAMFRLMVMRIREREAIGAFGREGIGIHLLTNGTLLDEATIEFLSRNHVQLSVSLDGLPCFHDRFRRDRRGERTYARVIAGIARTRKRGLDISIESIVTDFNAGALARFVRSMRDRFGIGDFYLNFPIGSPVWQRRFRLTMPRKRLAQIFDRLLDIEDVCIEPLASRWRLFLKGFPVIASHSCMDAGRLVVYPDGGAAPCPACGGEKGMPRLASIQRLVRTAFWKRFSSAASIVNPSCAGQCALIGFCDGGCPLNAMSLAPGEPRPECTIAHAMLECFVWRRWHRRKDGGLHGMRCTEKR